MLLHTDLGDSRAMPQKGPEICSIQDLQAEPKNNSYLSLLASTSVPAPTTRYPSSAAEIGHSSAGSMLIMSKVVFDLTIACSPSRIQCVVLLPG